MNRKIRELEDQIINLVNMADIPIEVKRLILSNVYHLVEKEADKVIFAEIAEMQRKKED